MCKYAVETAQQAEPIVRTVHESGEEVWQANGYREVRAILSDASRFGCPADPMYRAARSGDERRVGRLLHMDPPDHGRYRRLFTHAFSARRIEGMAEQIRQATQDQLDVLAAGPNPTDLVDSFALPIPERILHEMLGIPHSERPVCHHYVETLLRSDLSPEEGRAAIDHAFDHMCEVITAKRANPSSDMMSELIATNALTDVELADMAITLLMGGCRTVSGMTAESIVCLRDKPEARESLARGGEEGRRAVEELLRHITIIQHGTDRIARSDVEIGGVHVRQGERIIAFLPAANVDPTLCPMPEMLDTSRTPVRHASFGFGPHQCIGQHLTRVELRIMLQELLQRFPTLVLATDPDNLNRRTNSIIGGIHYLSVTW